MPGRQPQRRKPAARDCCCLDSIAELKTLAPGALPCAALLGYRAPGDGGGGQFYWDSQSTEPDNGGTVIAPASNPPAGRWKRATSSPLSVKCFGAQGNAIDDTTAVQAAIDSGPGTLLFPPGVYRVSRQITISTACRLLGFGSGPGGNNSVGNNDQHGAILEWDPPVPTDNMFLLTGVAGNVSSGVGTTFENLLLRQVAGNGAGSQGSAIRVGNELTTDNFKPSWTRIRNCTFETGAGKDDWTYCIYLDGSGTSGPAAGFGIRDTWIENVRCVSGANAKGSIHAVAAGNLYILDSLMNVNGSIELTGADFAHRSAGVFLNNVNSQNIILDHVQQVVAVGGLWNNLITTENANSCDLRPGFLEDNPTFNAISSFLYVGVFAQTGGPLWIAPGSVEYRSQSFVWRAGVQATLGTLDNQDLAIISNGSRRVLVKSSGSVNLAPNGALPVNASEGFTYIPTCAGVPTGVPSVEVGSVPMVYDTTNNSFYIFNGTWKKVSLV
jgi:hypothetical protein